MRPQDSNQTPVPSADPPRQNAQADVRDTATDVVRGQLETIYTTQASDPITTQTPAAPHPSASTGGHPQAEQWKQYHSAWQDYYQQYYERYYTGHLHRVLEANATTQAPTAAVAEPEPTLAPPANQEEAMFDLREKLRSNVKQSAKKVRKSRHFIPITAAVLVVLLFAFLQYNSLLIGTVQAYVSPGAIDPQNIVIDPNTQIAVSADPRIIIPKINVDAPVVYGAASDYASMMTAMQDGVAHFSIPGANSVPGQKGNTVFSGHSSSDIFGAGNYKFIFAQLNKLENGDTIYVNYQSKRYTYSVTGKKMVAPTDVSTLYGVNDRPIITLITCWPIGTANQRIILTAEQISPDPAQAAAAQSEGTATSGAMPGNGGSALERLFGNNGG